MDRPKYTIEIFWSDEDGGYIANVPDLAYCSAFGESYEEALREVLVAMELHLDTLTELGRPLPELGSRRGIGPGTTVVLDSAHVSELAEEAGQVAGQIVDETGEVVGLVVEDLGEGAGQMVGDIAEGAGQMAGGEPPIGGYDEMNIGEITTRLDDLSGTELARLRDYERRTKNRETLLEQVERRIAAS